jgi:hypothetical protein
MSDYKSSKDFYDESIDCKAVNVKIDDYYALYSDKTVNEKLFKSILVSFFKKISLMLLTGSIIRLPYIGWYKIIKVKRTVKRQIDFGKTNANKKLGIDEIAFRTNLAYFKISWQKNTRPQSYFTFKLCYANERAIPKHELKLDLVHKQRKAQKNVYKQ